MILLLRRKIQLKKSACAFYKSSQTIVSLLCNLLRLSLEMLVSTFLESSLNDPCTSNDFSTLKRITDKNKTGGEELTKRTHACFTEKERSIFQGIWLWMYGEYPRRAAIPRKLRRRYRSALRWWLRRCCRRRRAVKTRTLELLRIPVQFV